jgi:hypothetical protein
MKNQIFVKKRKSDMVWVGPGARKTQSPKETKAAIDENHLNLRNTRNPYRCESDERNKDHHHHHHHNHHHLHIT